jgi:hypothetical protein
MKKLISENINNPQILEKLYRENKLEFKKYFDEISNELNSELIHFWKIRLEPDVEVGSTTLKLKKRDLILVILISLATGILVKLPEIFSQIEKDFFYTRNLSIIIFNGIILYFFWQNSIKQKNKTLIYVITLILLILFVNFLPNKLSDSIILTLIHIPLLMWCLFGLSFISFDFKSTEKRMEFIRFNGELIIMIGLLLIAGGILTGITLALFHAININIETFYFQYVVVFGCVSSPIIASYILKIYPNLTNKITPVIARVFTPLVLITLLIYFVAFLFSKSKIVEDRDLLIFFNFMLLAVMLIVVFSVSELDKSNQKNTNVFILFLLVLITILINSIALFAIISRIFDGLTPNRIVVLVSNVLIFVNLILLLKNLFESYFKGKSLNLVEQTVAKYLSIYVFWTIIVIFILPFVFGLK